MKEMKYIVEISRRRFEVILPAHGSSGVAQVNGKDVEYDLLTGSAGNQSSLIVAGRSLCLETEKSASGITIRLGGASFDSTVTDERHAAILRLTGGSKPKVVDIGELRAPMPGLVIKIVVAEGDQVTKGQGVAVIEAMKMENEIRAQSNGLVTRVHVKVGRAVEKGESLLTIKSA